MMGDHKKGSTVVQSLQLGWKGASLQWSARVLADMQAAARLSFSSPFVVSWCLDAAQIGKPHRDMLVSCQTCRPQDEHCILPPKETWILIERLFYREGEREREREREEVREYVLERYIERQID